MSVFSKLKVFNYSTDDKLTLNALKDIANNNKATSTTNVVDMTIGFEAPFYNLTQNAAMIETIHGYLVAQLVIEERKPKRVDIDRETTIRVHKYMKENPDTRITRKVRGEIQKNVKADLVKKTQPTKSYYLLAFDIETNDLLINCTSSTVLKQVTGFLASPCDIGLMDVDFHPDITTKLTDFIEKPNDNLTEHFEIGNNAGLVEGEKKEAVKAIYSNQDLGSHEIEENLECGKKGYFVELIYREYARLRINKDNALTNIAIANKDEMSAHVGGYDAPAESTLLSEGTAVLTVQLMLIRVLVPDVIALCGGSDLSAGYIVTDSDSETDTGDMSNILLGNDE